MPFPKKIREEALVKSKRRCCICHDFAGRAINVHHIKQECDDGENNIENAIVLCLRCHSEAGHFNPKHPIGTKYSPKEIKRHRDNWLSDCESGKANYNLSVETVVKRISTSPELRKYRFKLKIINGSKGMISDYKVEVFIPNIIKIETQEVDRFLDTHIAGYVALKG